MFQKNVNANVGGELKVDDPTSPLFFSQPNLIIVLIILIAWYSQTVQTSPSS